MASKLQKFIRTYAKLQNMKGVDANAILTSLRGPDIEGSYLKFIFTSRIRAILKCKYGETRKDKFSTRNDFVYCISNIKNVRGSYHYLAHVIDALHELHRICSPKSDLHKELEALEDLASKLQTASVRDESLAKKLIEELENFPLMDDLIEKSE